MRFWGTEWKGLPPEEALRFFDTNGVVVRRQGMLDGEAIGYFAIENDPVLKKRYGSDIDQSPSSPYQTSSSGTLDLAFGAPRLRKLSSTQ